MKNIRVGTKNQYDVKFCNLNEIGNSLLSVAKGVKVMVVTDNRVADLYLDVVMKSLKDSDFGVFSYILQEGEMSKNFDTYLQIIKEMHANTFLRSDIIVALGGGVVGDIAGLCSATYMRGLKYVQVPTTLLAMIDSSIGGKTAIDYDNTKNLIGAFYQPSLVLVDVSTLSTLEDVEWKNGLGEGIKYAILKGGKIARLVEMGISSDNVCEFVGECIKYKASIVKRDEYDRGLRRLLNLGHTVGHALESESGYTLKHGIAVAKGIKVMLDASLQHDEISVKEYRRIENMLKSCGFYDSTHIDVERIMRHVALDKKADDTSITIVKIMGVGRPRLQRTSQQDFSSYLMSRN